MGNWHTQNFARPIFPPKYLYYLSTTPYIINRRNKNCALAIPNDNCEYNSQNFVYLLWQKSTAPTREVDIWGLNLCSSETPINQKRKFLVVIPERLQVVVGEVGR